MIPPKTSPIWTNLVNGTTDYKFANAATSMMIFNMRTQFKKDPSRLPAIADEVHKFFVKYERILADDVKRVLG
jgi:hypothetical protein